MKIAIEMVVGIVAESFDGSFDTVIDKIFNMISDENFYKGFGW